MISPLAARIRYAGIAYIIVQTVIWHSFYTHHPWRLTGPAVAVAWGLAVAARLRRSWPSHWFACLDCLIYVVLAAGAQACVPPAVRDDAFSWLVISLSGQLMVPAWYSPGVLSVLPPLCAPLFFGAGALLQPVTNGRTLAMSTIMLLVIGFVHGCGRRICYRRATAADAGLNRADQAAGEQYAALQVALERREQERLVHDTVLNTLTALSRAGGDDPALVIDRSRRDVDLIEAALTGTGPLAAGAGRQPRERPGLRPGESPGRRLGPGDRAGLPGRVQSVATAMRGRGLTVHLELPDEAGPAIPEPVVTALVNATREALSNVAAHAGTGEAWVEVRTRPTGLAAVPYRAEVTVRDRGAGFDPAYVDPARLGLRRSIAQRAAEYGGQASIWSAPGRGTEVFLRWPAPALPPSAESASAAPGARPPWNTAPFPAVLVPAGRDRAAGGPAQEVAHEP